jgi:hypothetical protein
VLATVALVSASVVLATATPASAAGEGTILSLVNQARADKGLGPLKLNSAMSAVALAWAKHMAANNSMVHNPNYSKQIPSGWTKAGENIAHGFSSPTAVHNGWMGSSGHRANILGDFTDIGIAFITVDGSTWAVEDFGKYGATSKPKPAPTAAPKPAKPPKSKPPAKSDSQVRPASPATPAAPAKSAPTTAPTPYVPDLSFLPESELASPSPAPEPPASSSPLPADLVPPSPEPSTLDAQPASATTFLPAGILLGLLMIGVWGSTGLLLWRRWRRT